MKVLAEGADGVNELCFSVHGCHVLYFIPVAFQFLSRHGGFGQAHHDTAG